MKNKALYTLFFSLLLMNFMITGCSTLETPAPTTEEPQEELVLSPASFSDLDGWSEDTTLAALPAMKASCERILKKDASAALSPALPVPMTYGELHPACRSVVNSTFSDDAAFRTFLENRFRPYKVHTASKDTGLFTGYYESGLKGSRTRTPIYKYPLHSRPDDLVMVDLGLFRDELKGQRIAGRVLEGNLKPYESREQIVNGEWPHNDEVLVWVNDPVDAFFVQIQGSGVVELASGDVMRIGYAGQNGHPYYAIGKKLIERGEVAKEDMSMQAIRSWLETHPDQADELMNTNRSYVFFTETGATGAKGAEGTVLTPERSLAVDRTKIPYGLPLFLSAEAPTGTAHPPLKRLMVAQDTGGAITGAVRGDVFWGYGDRAETIAGAMKSKGEYWIFLPK